MNIGAWPVLVAASHGTSDPTGQRAIAALVMAVSDTLADIEVVGSFVDVQQPDVPTSLASLDPDSPAVIVPLLLSAGYHVRVDLAEAAAGAVQEVLVTGALGPDAHISGILATRLAEAGLAPDDHVVLAAAGSSDARAVEDCRLVGRQLAQRLGREVTVGFISAAEPRLSDAVDSARRDHPGQRVVIASYLLAPGYFASLAHEAGADVVSATLLTGEGEPPAALIQAVVDRYEATVAAM